MSAIKKLQLRTTSLILTFAILVGCVFTTAVTRSAFAASDSGHDSGHDSGAMMIARGAGDDEGHPDPIVYNEGEDDEVTLSKSAEKDSGDNRDFSIQLGVKADTKIISEEVPCDIILVLDNSKGMANAFTRSSTGLNVKRGSLDTSKTYYYQSGASYYLVQYRSSKWQYFNGSWIDLNNTTRTYYEGISKLDALKQAAGAFVDNVAASSTDSRIGVARFSYSANYVAEYNDNYLLKVKNVNSLNAIKNGIQTLSPTSHSDRYADEGFEAASDLFDDDDWQETPVTTPDNRKKIVVFFTGGEPSDYGDAEDAAEDLRDDDTTIYSIGVFNDLTGGDLQDMTDFMEEVASQDEDGEKLYFPSDNLTELNESFNKVQATVGGLAGVEVRDYIDDRFTLVKESLPEGAVAHTDANGQYVSWSGLTIDSTHRFSQTIHVRAKKTTGGVDYVPTNNTEYSGVYANGELEYNFPEPMVQIERVPATAGLTASKTASLTDWDTRKYNIQLEATAHSETEVTTPNPSDIILVLDRSGSMAWHMYTAENSPVISNAYYIYRTDTTNATDGPYQKVTYNGSYWSYSGTRVYPTEGGTGIGGHYQFYTQGAQTRLEALKAAAGTFVDNLKLKSPDSRIGVVQFSSNDNSNTKIITNNDDYQLLRVGNSTSTDAIHTAINGLKASGSTAADLGLKKAQDLFDATDKYEEVDNESDRQKLVIFFTDGEPNHGSGFDAGVAEDAETEAGILKAEPYNATVYSIGVFSGLSEAAKITVENYMKDVASFRKNSDTEKRYYPAGDPIALNEIFDSISQEVGEISDATITDTIDPRFDLLDAEGNLLSKTEANSVYGGEANYDNGRWQIIWDDTSIGTGTWDDDTMTAPGWQQTIKIQAKPEFVGGNDIPTNVAGESEVTVEGDSLTFGDSPTVNVKPVFYLDNTDTTIFRGEEVADSTLVPYTFDRDGEKVTGDDIFCGEDSTGDFSYQWFKAEWVSSEWVKDANALAASSGSAAFPAAITPDDSTFYMLVATFDPSADGDSSKANCIDETHPEGRVAGNAQNTTVLSDNHAPNGVYTVNVVKGQLVIEKTINIQYPAPDSVRAKQNFVFKIERREHLSDATPADTFYEVITPGSSLSGSKTITGLKKGFYKVTEETGDAWRYTQTAVRDNDVVAGGDYSSTSADQQLYIGRLTSAEGITPKTYFGSTLNQATIEFANKLVKGKWLGDTTVKVNTISAAVPAT